MCFFLSHSFVALSCVFGSLSCWNTHPRPIFNALPWLQCPGPDGTNGPVHRPFDAVQLSCPLSRKTPQRIMFPPPCLRWGWRFWGHRQHSSSSKHGDLSWCPIWSHLTSNTFTQFSSESLANFRRACTCAFLSRGTLRALQDFSPFTA